MDKLTLCAFADEAGAALSEQIDALTANGIPYIELRGVNGKNISDHTPEEAKEVADTLKAHGISVWSIGSPIGKVKITSPFDHELARFENTLAIARATGARCIRLFSFFDTSALGEGAHDEVMARLTAFAETAENSGVILCHENEKGIYGDNTEKCRAIVDSVPAVRSVFDPANFVQCGVDTRKAWASLADSVYYLHIKDALLDGTVVPAGYGDGHVREIVSDYLARDGKVATLEPHLHAFTGLSALSGEDAKAILGNRRFAGGREAFDFAVSAFRSLLESL